MHKARVKGQIGWFSCVVERKLNSCISLGNFDYLCEHVSTWIYWSTFDPLRVKVARLYLVGIFEFCYMVAALCNIGHPLGIPVWAELLLQKGSAALQEACKPGEPALTWMPTRCGVKRSWSSCPFTRLLLLLLPGGRPVKLTNVLISPLSSSAKGETAERIMRSISEATDGRNPIPLNSGDNARHSGCPGRI